MARGIRRLGRGGRSRGAERAAPSAGPAELRRLLDTLPLTLRRQALTHSSWVEHRADSYGRLAFLGDSVLGLAIAEHLFRAHPRADIGRLTKMHGQAVSGRACAEVAVELGVPQLLEETAPITASQTEASATVAAFRHEIEIAAERLLDFKSALQERLAREGTRVRYEVTSENGPPHDRVFEVAASVSGEVIGYGAGRSKKAAEQAAAEEALASLAG